MTLSEAARARCVSASTAFRAAQRRGLTFRAWRGHTDETKAKIGAAGRGRKLSDETKARISAALRGRKHTDETKAKMSAAKRGRSPLAALTEAERADYDILRRKGGQSRAEALRAIGRADLAGAGQ
jgi:hypothetical protein